MDNANTFSGTSSQQGNSFLNKLPFGEHLNKLPAPIRDFVSRRPGTTAGIAALAGLALLSVRRRHRRG